MDYNFLSVITPPIPEKYMDEKTIKCRNCIAYGNFSKVDLSCTKISPDFFSYSQSIPNLNSLIVIFNVINKI